MFDSFILFALKKRWLVLLLTTAIAALGVYNSLKLPMDAVPDISNVQVQINTQAKGYSPLESEQRISRIIERSMSGLPNLDYSRSLSRYGLSQVTITFKDGTDIYWARQQISERLQNIRSQLPKGSEPTLSPISSGLGEIYSYVVRAEPWAKKANGNKYNLEDLRTIQDWIIRPQLITVKGITEINSLGGYEREYQVTPITEQLLRLKVTLPEIISALKNNNQNIGAGFIRQNGEQWLLRSPGQLKDLNDIGNVIIKKNGHSPIRIKDVANVQFGKQLRTGAATLNGQETVLGTAFMLLGENSRTVSQAVHSKLIDINASLPNGIVAEAIYNRTNLVNKTISTVQRNLFEGAVLVIAILFAFLGNIRAALITALIIPLSMLFAVSGMAMNRVSGNLMSLGAIDFGLIIDGAVIVVENCLRRLSLAQQACHEKHGRWMNLNERVVEVAHSTLEVIRPAVFGVFIIMLVYLPIFALSGIEGKMFQPMAFTVIAALFGALIFSITFIPAAIAIFIKGNRVHKENTIMAFLKHYYSHLLDKALINGKWILLCACLILSLCVIQAFRMGSEFLPKLDEYDVALHALRIPGTSLSQSVDMQKLVEKEIQKFDEVATVFSKVGTAEIATDPMPPSVADTFVIFKPQALWPDPNKDKKLLVEELKHALQGLPGNQYEFTQPIEMRFNELISGVRSDVALRIYGDDLSQLETLGQQANTLLQTVYGANDVRLSQVQGLPMLSVEPRHDHLTLLGLNIENIQQALQAAVQGIEVGHIYEGDKRFNLLVRFEQVENNSIDHLNDIPVLISNAQHNGNMGNELSYVPLSEVAHIRQVISPNQINRQNGKRFIVVSANVKGTDLSSFIQQAKHTMSEQLNLPNGYWLEYGGTFEQLQSARQRLMWLVPLTLLLILGLLYSVFNSMRHSLIIFSSVPLALSGGIIALTLRDIPLSISAAVGFIALCGISILNAIVMLSFINQLLAKNKPLMSAIKQGAIQRLRPVLMTALVASLGFVPMAFNTGTGAEVQRPLATVVIGGIMTSTLLTLFILPVLYKFTHKHN